MNRERFTYGLMVPSYLAAWMWFYATLLVRAAWEAHHWLWR